MFDAKTYRPAGPKLKAFHESDAYYRGVAGPVGAGKTVACGVAEPIFAGMVQLPEADGVRRCRIGVLRDTYRNLYRTTMRTWKEWIPPSLGNFVGSDDRPASHNFTLDTPIGPIEMFMEWLALGNSMDIEAVCGGWEINGAYADEATGMPREAVTYLGGRVKRGGLKQYRRSRGVWFSFNKGDVDDWTYDMCVEDPPDDFEFFDQPPGILPGGPPYIVNPEAENLANLDDDYYEKSCGGQPEWYVTRMGRNEWGASVAGQRIYPTFAPVHHVSAVEREPPPGAELRLGLDGGGTPAAVIAGRDGQGRVIVYAEVVLADPDDPKGVRLLTGVGPGRFAERIKQTLHPRFSRCSLSLGHGDPAAFYGADRENGEYSFMEKVGLALGISIMPAESNEIGLRLEAVNSQLFVPGVGPNLIINPSCRFLRRGFVSDYKWEPVDQKQPGKNLKPQKTRTSHVHDALQYVVLGLVGRAGVMAGARHDRWQPSSTGLLLPPNLQIAHSPGIDRPWEGPMRATVAGTHYNIEFNPWKS